MSWPYGGLILSCRSFSYTAAIPETFALDGGETGAPGENPGRQRNVSLGLNPRASRCEAITLRCCLT